MEELRLGVVESQFAEIIWSNEPLPSGELVKLCEQKLGWKKSTTYTVLKRLCERGIFQNEKGMVSARMTKEEYDAARVKNLWRTTLEVPFRRFLPRSQREKN